MMDQINEMIMKKILLTIILFLSFSAVYSQSERKLKKMAEENAELIDDLKSKKDVLDKELSRINTEIAKIEHRSFERETPELNLKKRLAWYKDVASLAKDISFQQKLKTSQPLFNTYSLIIEMYLSLQVEGGYQKEKNDFYKNQFGALKHQLSILDPAHEGSFIQSFENLLSQISDYRFTMFELVRLFDLVDEKENEGMEKAKIYSSLKADEETEIVDKIPFTQGLLRTYIKSNSTVRSNIRKYDTFKTIK